MGVQFDRILEGFTGPFEKITEWNTLPLAGRIAGSTTSAGYVFTRRTNNSFIALNRLLAANEEVFAVRSAQSAGTASIPPGSFYVRSGARTRAQIDRLAATLGVGFDGTPATPPADAVRVRTPRVGLWDVYGGSMPSGWTRWILEHFEFPFQRVFAQELDAGNLNQKFDALVFVTGAIPGTGGTGGRGGGGRGAGAGADTPPADLPAEYRTHWGRMTAERTLPHIKAFIENGGTVVAIGSSATNLATYLQLPLSNHLVENGAPLPSTKFYVPGSVLRARVDTTLAIARGMTAYTDFFFDDSPVFKLGADATSRGVRPIAWFDSKTPLRSGWAWGQEYLEGGVIAVEATVGRGRVLLYSAEILQRAQPHGTFKLLFNALH
jgi:hypothetical protein